MPPAAADGGRVPAIERALITLMLACVAPLALAAALLIEHVYHGAREGLTANAIDHAHAIAELLDHHRGTPPVAAAPQHLTAVLAAQALPRGWRAAVVDPGATIVARSNGALGLFGAPVLPELRAHLLLYGEGAYETVAADGARVLTVYSQAPVSGWTIALRMSRAELDANLNRSIALLVLATAAAAAAALLFASSIARRIARDLRALNAPAAQLGNNAPLAMPPLHFAETRQLGVVFERTHRTLAVMAAGLRASEQRLAAITEATGTGLWVRTLATAEIWASSQWRMMFCFPPDQVLQLGDVVARIHPDDRPSVTRALQQIMVSGSAYDIEFRLLLPGGVLRWIASRGRIGHDASGQPATVLGVSSDVSARKLAELALQKKQDDQVHLSRVSLLGELTATLAHELNQPLTSILSNAQAAQRLLERPQAPLAQLREILADIVAEDRRASAVIGHLRALLRNSATVREAIDFQAVAGDVLCLLRNDLLNRDMRVDVAIATGLPPVLGDRVQLQQVLINLVSNSCDAIAGCATAIRSINITATASADRGWVILAVRDGGPGLADQRGEHIFEPFHSTRANGMGLGLSICRKIVHAHGGRISASNHPDGGALIRVELPAHHD